MTASQSTTLTSQDILKGAMINGVINAVINGGIQYFLLRGNSTIPLSVDAISTATHTVLGSAAPLAVSLAMILTAVAHWTLKAPKKPFIPTTLLLILKHGLLAFGAVVAGAVVWQRSAGTVDVSLVTAVVLLGLIAGLVAAVVNYLTIKEITEV